MSKFKIDLSFVLFILLILLSPKQIIIFKLFISLIFHELGHLLVVLIYKIKYRQITLSLFGFIMEIDEESLNFIESFLFYSMGIIFNFILVLLTNDRELSNINIFLLIINIVPIYPLDGHQIIKTLIEYIIPIYYAYIVRIVISVIGLGFVISIFIKYNIDIYLIINYIFVVNLNYDLIKNWQIYYRKFLLYRYLNNINKKIKTIKFTENYINKLYRYRIIQMSVGDRKINEKELLNLYFNK